MTSRGLEFIVRAGLVVAARIHLLPLPGVLGAAVLQSAYGLPAIDPATELLLQHRALMFALLSCFLLAAVFRPPLRIAAICLVLLSDLSFIALCLSAEDLGAELIRVAVADALSVLVLILAAIANHHLRLRARLASGQAEMAGPPRTSSGGPETLP